MKAQLILTETPYIEIEGNKIDKPIDYNGIDFGIVDVDKLAIEKYPLVEGFKNISKDIDNEYRRDGFIEGFKASQQLNEKKFTAEEVEKAISMARLYPYIKKGSVAYDKTPSEIIQSLSPPKTFEVEIEETPTNIKIIKKL